MANKFIDVASYQPDTLVYFKAAKRLGVKGVVVKITEGSATGTDYVNPKAANQIKHAKKVGMIVSGYHFLRSLSVPDAKQEAQFFIKEAKKRGLSTKATCVVDVEAADLTHNVAALTQQINAFFAEVRRSGFKKMAIYSNTSWFKTRINRSNLTVQNFWVASYGTVSAGMPCKAWQYSSNQMINSAKTDISVDYQGMFTKKVLRKQKKQPQKIKQNKKWVDNLGVTWYQEQGTFISDRAINLRWGARTSSTKIALLRAGSVVKYDAFAHSGGYVWLRQPRGKGQYGYLATGKSKNGRRSNYWGKFK
ncbi:GH25 family lysozyme [Ligilactobacillus pobuzihii]|nr:GH25 family lysozyme [Ligilactobacillus pobuzihii]GEN49063.1 hypothetical protein LPO01_18550 [Ligilactobacillus pobuzihii]